MDQIAPNTSAIQLAGQTAIVTGANSGIGRATAIALAQAGADIVINYEKDRESAEGLAHELEAMGRQVIAVKADVSLESDCEHLFAKAIGHFSTVHIVICNAGVQFDAPLSDMTLEQWNRVIQVNLTSQFLCMRSSAREFIRRGLNPRVSKSVGKIVSVSSIHQDVPWAGHANYAASKAGVMMLVKSAALELAPKGIRVNAVAPGAIRTPINRNAWESPAALRELGMLIPYGRIGEPEEIGNAIAWLSSDSAEYISGATLVIDGGLSLRI